MTPLTLEQRAKRNATRLNNKEKKKHPLFADQFSTTIDEQTTRLANLSKATNAYFAREEDRRIEQWKIGDQRRTELARIITQDQLAACDAKWSRTFGPNGVSPRTWGSYGHEYWLSHWWQCAKQYAPEWAQEHCPNAQFHEYELYQREGKCPTCYKPLKLPETYMVITQAALL